MVGSTSRLTKSALPLWSYTDPSERISSRPDFSALSSSPVSIFAKKLRINIRYCDSVIKNCTSTVSMRETVFKMMGLG